MPLPPPRPSSPSLTRSHPSLRVAPLCLIALVALFSLVIEPVLGQDPSVCVESGAESYDCNCISTNCQTCSSCGCAASTFGSTCASGSCGDSGCWCSPSCTCCRSEQCTSYSCNCQTQCQTCQRETCVRSQTYSARHLSPSVGPLAGGTTVTIHGVNFVDMPNIVCRFGGPGFNSAIIGSQSQSGTFIDTGRISCVTPDVNTAGPILVEVSIDAGATYTNNGLRFEYKDCTGSDCDCPSGFAGSNCNLACETGCTTHGTCVTRIVGTTETAFCSCNSGWWGTSSSTNGICGSTCPGGSTNPCNGNGICNDQTGVCECDGTHWGTQCASTCSGIVTIDSVEKSCNGQGSCNPTTGTCSCFNLYYGSECDSLCPGAGIGLACQGNGFCSTATNGVCACSPPWSGSQCDEITCLSSDCSGHGNCITETGVCRCTDGWSDRACSTPPAVSGATYGSIAFVTGTQTVGETAGSFTVTMRRSLGSTGRQTAIVSTYPGTARADTDYYPLYNVTVTWEESDVSDKTVRILLVTDSTSETNEQFYLSIDGVFGLGQVGAPSTTTITITESSTPTPSQVGMSVWTLQLLLPYSAGTSTTITNQFIQQLTSALGIVGTNRVTVSSLVSNGGTGSTITFQLHQDPSSGQSVFILTNRFLQDGFLLLPNGGIFTGLSVAGQMNYLVQPILSLAVDDDPPSTAASSTGPALPGEGGLETGGESSQTPVEEQPSSSSSTGSNGGGEATVSSSSSTGGGSTNPSTPSSSTGGSTTPIASSTGGATNPSVSSTGNGGGGVTTSSTGGSTVTPTASSSTGGGGGTTPTASSTGGGITNPTTSSTGSLPSTVTSSSSTAGDGGGVVTPASSSSSSSSGPNLGELDTSDGSSGGNTPIDTDSSSSGVSSSIDSTGPSDGGGDGEVTGSNGSSSSYRDVMTHVNLSIMLGGMMIILFGLL